MSCLYEPCVRVFRGERCCRRPGRAHSGPVCTHMRPEVMWCTVNTGAVVLVLCGNQNQNDVNFKRIAKTKHRAKFSQIDIIQTFNDLSKCQNTEKAYL